MFNPNIKIGDILTESELCSCFGCQTQLGIRLNKANNAIIIVSTPYKRDYADVWDGDTLYYVGTNASSNENGQTLSGHGNNNGALLAVWDSRDKPTIFLFEKYERNKCTYKGVVTLCKEPFMEPKSTDSNYMIWRFPLQLIETEASVLNIDFTSLEREESKKGFDDLKHAVDNAKKSRVLGKEHISRTVKSVVFDRNPLFSSYVKKRAKGRCDLCGDEAPFIDKDGNPYLESHHVVWLSRGGIDYPDNIVAVCPNCHSRIHVLDDESDKQKLIERLAFYSTQGV